MTIFIDTSAFYAMLDRDDVNNQRAKDIWINLVETETPLITSNYILIETFALLQHRLGIAALQAFYSDVLSLVHQHWLDKEDHEAALAAILVAQKRDLSFVDTSSFQIMRRLGLNEVFTFDAHFSQHGFVIIS
ncbi:MAG: PIN domain-containing protein [Deltaproteobacteria bacterium]|nr:PIN domain-containing protein [Deltaproteobacteria bacterium]